MNYITTTQLRTRSSELVSELKKGKKISLIHRSRVIGEIKPAQKEPVAITDIEAFKSFLESIRPKKLIPRKNRDKIYRKHLAEKYGKDLL